MAMPASSVTRSFGMAVSSRQPAAVGAGRQHRHPVQRLWQATCIRPARGVQPLRPSPRVGDRPTSTAVAATSSVDVADTAQQSSFLGSLDSLDSLDELDQHDMQPQQQQQQPQPQQQATGAGWLDKLVQPPNRVTGLILLNVMTILCASNWVVVKHSAAMLDPQVFVALRFCIAATACLPVLFTSKQNAAVLKGGMEIGAYMAVGYLTQSFALQATDASRASLLSTFTVLAVPLMAGLSGRHIKPFVWLCCLGSIFGTGLLENGGQPPNWGDALAVVSAIAFGVQIFRTESISRSLPATASLQVTAIAMLSTAATTSAAAVLHHAPELTRYAASLTGHLPADAAAAAASLHNATHALPWAELAYTGICSTVLVLAIEMVVLNTVSSTEAAIVYATEPLLGALAAYVLLGERWGWLGWVGAGLITASSLGAQLLGAEEDEAPAASQEDK